MKYVNKLALEAYPIKLVTTGDNPEEWDENEQYRECWIEGHNKALTIHSVGNHVFCPHCGDKRQLKVEADLNSGRVCKSRLCKGK